LGFGEVFLEEVFLNQNAGESPDDAAFPRLVRPDDSDTQPQRLTQVYEGVGKRDLLREGLKELLEVSVDLLDPCVNERLRLSKEELFLGELGESGDAVLAHVVLHLRLQYLAEGEQLGVALHDVVLDALLVGHARVQVSDLAPPDFLHLLVQFQLRL